LLDDLVRPEAEERVHRIVRLQDLALEVGDEDGIRRVLDQALRVGARLVQLAHVAKDADGTDHAPAGVAQRGRVQTRRDHFSGRVARVQQDIPADPPLDDLAQRGHELARLLHADEA
jgi:hypothetical protein